MISQGKTPEQFDQFSSMSLTIISIQVLLLYLSLSDPAKTFGKLPLPPDVVKGFQSSLTATMSLLQLSIGLSLELCMLLWNTSKQMVNC